MQTGHVMSCNFKLHVNWIARYYNSLKGRNIHKFEFVSKPIYEYEQKSINKNLILLEQTYCTLLVGILLQYFTRWVNTASLPHVYSSEDQVEVEPLFHDAVPLNWSNSTGKGNSK